MKKLNYTPRFFLGANTPCGFVSKFDNLYKPEEDWFCYIIKGGPGTGKSTFMKNLALKAYERDIKTEFIYCSSDPSSLDAIIFPEIKKCLVDGTAPHVLDPIYPGVSDAIINMGEFWDKSTIKESREEIIKLTKNNTALHMKSKRYLSAFGFIDNDISRIMSDLIHKEKVSKYTSGIVKKMFKAKRGKQGTETIRFISGITPDGFIFFDDTIRNYYNSITIIEDTYGVGGSLILSYLRTGILTNGYDIITCLSPIAPKNRIECLLIPETRSAFAISDYRHALDFKENAKRIHIKRFIDTQKLSTFKHRMLFNKKMEQELLDEAVRSLKEAKSIHDQLEEIYIKSMNFEGIDALGEKVAETLFK